MSLVKVKTKGQITLPMALRREVGLNIGDLLDAKIQQGKITLTPQTLIDRHIAESKEQIGRGEFYGPFATAQEMVESLHRNGKKTKNNNTRKRAVRK